jgi:hypothetical protein
MRPDAESSVDAVLARIHAIGTEATAEDEGEAYSISAADFSSAWEAAATRLRELIDGLASFATAVTTVEAGGGVRSIVSWTGDLSVVCSPAVTPEQLREHFETLDTAIRRRSRMILIAAASVQASACICAAIASPAASGSALRSIGRLVCELQAISP